MKKILFLVLAVLFCCAGYAQSADTLTLGSEQSYNASFNPNPFTSHWLNVRSICMYTAEELSTMPEGSLITHLSWKTGMVEPHTTAPHLKIYLLEIPENSLNVSSTYWNDLVSDATLVYDSTGDAVSDAWNTIALTNEYRYKGKNLVVISDNYRDPNTPSYEVSLKYFPYIPGSSMAFGTYTNLSFNNDTLITAMSGNTVNTNTRYHLRIQYLNDGGSCCPMQQDVQLVPASYNGALLSWDYDNNVAEYRVQGRRLGQSWANSEFPITVPTFNEYLFSGLQGLTDYQFRFSTICLNGDTSVWETFSYHTPCPVIDSTNLPYFEDFENVTYNSIPQCWSRIMPSDGVSTISVLGGSVFGGGNHTLRVWSADNPDSCVFAIGLSILPELLPHVSMSLKIDLSATYGVAPIDIGVMTDTTDTSTFILARRIQVSEFDSQGWYIQWPQEFRIWFDSLHIEGDEPVYFAFRDYCKHELDDILIDYSPSCHSPEHLHATNISGSSAELSWDDVAESYFVYYWWDSTASIDSVVATLDSNGTFTLTGLQQQKTYYWYVSSVCSDGTHAPSFVHSFSTSCGPVTIQDLPYIQDFEGVGNNLLPPCWTRTLSAYTTSGTPSPGTIAMNTTYNGMIISHRCLSFHTDLPNRLGIVTTQLLDIDLSQVGLNFLLESVDVSGGYFDVGLMTNPSDSSTFTLVKRIPRTDVPNNLFEYQSVWFGNFPIPASNVYLAFRANGNWNLDNVELIYTGECAIPDTLSVLSVDTQSIKVGWPSDQNVVFWTLASRAENETLWNYNTAPSSIYTLTGLEPASTYYFKVRSRCASGLYSDWSEIVSCTTDTLPIHGGDDDDDSVSVENYLSNSFYLYPNPAKEAVYVQCLMKNVQLENVDIEVFDIYGKQICTIVETHGYSPMQACIDVSGLPNGVYLVRVTTEQGVVTKRFVKANS